VNQTLLPLPSAASYALADYVLTDTNRNMFDGLMQPDKWNSYACLLIGEQASGKTHLSRIWQEKFSAHFMQASDLFANRLPTQTHVIIEDIDSGGSDESVLFHALNHARESGQTLLLTASAQPKYFVTLPDVLSRLNALFALHIPPPDEILVRALLQKFFSDRQLRVENGVIQYISARCERSYGAIHALVQRLDESSLIKKQGVTIPLAKQVLE
jgi:chromosomal replication initiation ATPase DnaA